MGKKRKQTNVVDGEPRVKKAKCMVAQDKPPADVVNDTVSVDDVISPETEEISEDVEMRNMVRSQNRKKKSGGFQSMGLSFAIFKGVMKKGYKVPTPIQRKTIPLIMDGKDVVAMARTGSGKTAAFLIPMFERLKAHSSVGVRALLLSPTRELSMQTLKFTKELGKYTGIKAGAIVGGDSMDDQFAALHENPDVIIATPGRLMHILIEMNLKLQSVEYVVFDEADRLFEMGFQDQLLAILARLPESRQTLLFSATLPKLLVDFARAGLHDPTLIRLDVDTKLSDQLRLAFLQCRSDDKMAVLFHLLRNVVQPTEQAVVFAATKHHVEYLNMVLTEAGIACSYSYSALDPTARKISVAKFRNKLTRVLIVTDLAARGIDIPLLDVVINYNFPAKPKLFIHRVGRVARAGRSGSAISIISPDELAYVIDLHLFLGRPLNFATAGKTGQDTDGVYGLVPQHVIDEQEEKLCVWRQKADIQAMSRVITNAYKLYCKSRPSPSSESTKRAKSVGDIHIAVHPMFSSSCSEVEADQAKLLDAMKTYRPHTTIFEINSTSRTQAFAVMKQKRQQHEGVINRKHKNTDVIHQRSFSASNVEAISDGNNDTTNTTQRMLDSVTDVEVNDAFTTVFAPKSKSDPYLEVERREERKANRKKKMRKASEIDRDNFLPYRPKDYQSEQGLGLLTSFEKDANNAVLDLTGDDEQEMRKSRSRMIWDRKKKKFVQATGLEKGGRKLRTESGKIISSSYKTNAYDQWLEKNKLKHAPDDSDGEDASQEETGRKWNSGRGRGRGKHWGGRQREEGGSVMRRKFGGKGNKRQDGAENPTGRGKQRFRRELREKSQIVKQRVQKAAKLAYQAHRADQKHNRNGARKGGRGSFRGRGKGRPHSN